MKTGTSILILLIASAAVCTETCAQPEAVSKANPVAARTQHFSSDLVFDISYPAEWTYNDLGPALPAAKMALDKQSESDS
jgi:hypothetical protein